MEIKEFVALYKRLKEVSGRVERVDVDDDGLLASITLNGFAKSGTLTVTRTERGILTHARYDETNNYGVQGENAVEDAFDSIVHDAYNWYLRGFNRGFTDPAEAWLSEFVARGLIEEVKTVCYRPKGR